MNLCGVRVNRIQELWLTGEQFGNGRKAFAVMNAGAKFVQSYMVEVRTIALVTGKTVSRKFLVECHHDPVARDFGDDRGGRDGKRAGIAGDNRLNPAGKFWRTIAVNQCIVWRFLEIVNRFRHGP